MNACISISVVVLAVTIEYFMMTRKYKRDMERIKERRSDLERAIRYLEEK